MRKEEWEEMGDGRWEMEDRRWKFGFLVDRLKVRVWRACVCGVR
ncbi:MAG: hypothetical protein RL750_380 [Bacteroidota bacterium]